jgi:beta-lactam-binding protein with PASTA domain
VVGDTLSSARAQIRQHHCRVGSIARKASANRLKGKVIHQAPKAGRRLANGHRVNLVVGKGRHH